MQPEIKPNIFRRSFDWFNSFFFFIWDCIKSFLNNDCYEKASALSFYTMLSIVPFLAVLFGISKGFGFGASVESLITDRFIQQPEIANKLIEFAHSNLENIKGGVITGIGSAFLLWSVIGLLNSIETITNRIFKVTEGRTYSAKIKEYLTFLIIAPLIFVISSAVNIYLIAQVTQYTEFSPIVGALSSVVLFFLNLFPFFLIWILFTLIYIFIPNKKIPYYEAIIAGVIAGTAFQIWQWVYIHLQLILSSYGAVYGSFAAIPLFMIYLQVSWLIVLAGAIIATEIEKGFFRKHNTYPLSLKVAALLTVNHCIDAFVKGKQPYTAHQLSKKLGITLDELQQVTGILLKHNILSKVNFNDDIGYSPARSVHDITINRVLDAIDNSYIIASSISDSEELRKMEGILVELHQAMVPIEDKPLYTVT